MKYFHLVIALFLSTGFFSCISDTPPPTSPPPFSPIGKWIAKDIDLDFVIDCKCTESEKASLRTIIKASMDALKGEYLKNGYIEFFNDKTYISEFVGEVEHGNYQIQNDGTAIKKIDNKDAEKEYLTIVKMAQEVGDDLAELHLKTNQSDLDKLTQTENIPNLGNVTYRITLMKIKFKK